MRSGPTDEQRTIYPTLRLRGGALAGYEPAKPKRLRRPNKSGQLNFRTDATTEAGLRVIARATGLTSRSDIVRYAIVQTARRV